MLNRFNLGLLLCLFAFACSDSETTNMDEQNTETTTGDGDANDPSSFLSEENITDPNDADGTNGAETTPDANNQGDGSDGEGGESSATSDPQVDESDTTNPIGPEVDPNTTVSASEHVGESEVGVVCGESASVCTTSEECCVTVQLGTGFSGSCSPLDGQCSGGFINSSFTCDEDADCGSGEICCVNIDASQLTDIQADSQCIAGDVCPAETQARACNTSADCGNGELCCAPDLSGLSSIIGDSELPLDIGACAVTDDCANISFF